MVTKNMGLLIGSKTVRWVQKGIMYCTATARHTKQKVGSLLSSWGSTGDSPCMKTTKTNQIVISKNEESKLRIMLQCKR
jgi:hypothetical protein